MKKKIKVRMQCTCVATVYADIDTSGNVTLEGLDEIEDVENVQDFEVLHSEG